MENKRQRYIPGEFELLMSVYDTVDRDRNIVKLVMLSNSGMLANPYFREYGIKLTDLDSYGIKKRRKGKVLIEYVNPTPFLDDSGKRPIDDIASKRYISYASQNIFADGSDKNIASVPKGLQPDRCFTSRDWDCTLYTDNDRRMFYGFGNW